jgi:hypothetical protein
MGAGPVDFPSVTAVRHGEAMPRWSIDKAAHCFSVLRGRERIKPARGLQDMKIVVLICVHRGPLSGDVFCRGQGALANPPSMGVVARDPLSVGARGTETG